MRYFYIHNSSEPQIFSRLFFFFFNDTATTEIYTFPYTTLFRSHGSRQGESYEESKSDMGRFSNHRSEEHTSELQSQSNLVCRLLLEKKKKKKKQKRYA